MALVDHEAAVVNSEATKACSRCEKVKPLSEFGDYKYRGEPRKRAHCLDCRSDWQRDHYAKPSTKAAQRDSWLRRNYGITLEQYKAMLAEQDGRCAVCRAEPGERTLDVDHCHDTGVVRGLLCGSCNNGIGRFQDDADLLRAAARYLDGAH